MASSRRCAALCLKPLVIMALGLVAFGAAAQPANDNFASATIIRGLTGTTNGDNTLASLEPPCETNIVNTAEAGLEPVTNSVWFAWTAPASGTLTMDTGGSDPTLDFVLSVWTSTNNNPTLCDGSLINIVSSDGYPADSKVSLQVVAGNTYYVEVSSYDDLTFPNDNSGLYVLNWSTVVPSLPSGVFKLTSQNYRVSETDSSAPINPDGGTVNPSVRGARVTVTRPAPGYGRVLVDYAVSAMNYTNTFVTNFFGTNLLTTYIDTNGIVSQTNYYSTNVYILYRYISWSGCGYQQDVLTNGYTNAATLVLEGVFQFTNPLVTGVVSPLPTNLPYLANYEADGTSVAGNTITSYTTNVFGSLPTGRPTRGFGAPNSGLTITNAGIIYTNFAVLFTNTPVTNIFGTNISIAITGAAGNPYFSTNYFYTNDIWGYIYSTNSVYTNGTLTRNVDVTGTNWIGGATSLLVFGLNASNRIYNVSPLVAATNIPPARTGSFTLGTSDVIDTSGNEIISVTNSYNQQVIGFTVVSASSGITTATNTLTFDNLQLSQDILVPVAQTLGPDFPAVSGIPSEAQITLSNPRLDALENPEQIIAPALDPANSVGLISALSATYAPLPGGAFNFERSTFRVDRNVNGGNAIISVNRVKGDPQLSVSVQYIIDPTSPDLAPNFGGCSPPCTFADGYNPANTFPLQSGSDYATPNVDYTPVTGTLSWGSYDYNPKQITIPIFNNGDVAFNEDLMIQLYNPLPDCTATEPAQLGEVNSAILTIPFDSTFVLGGQAPGQQPVGAVDRTWNKDNANDSTPPYLNYPGTTPGQNGTVYAVATQPDGRAIIAGSFVSFDSTPYNRIVRTLPNGYQDPTFLAAPNSGANAFIAAVALQPDGRIVIGGNFTAFNGFNRHYIARLNSDGSVDTSFNPGLGANGTVWSIALDPATGKIVMAGAFTTYNGAAVNQVARLNTDGSLDTNFICAAIGTGADVVDAVAVDGSGRVLIAGNFDAVGGVASGAVARLNADGSLDTLFTPGIGTFNPDTYVTDPVHAIAVQADGKVLIGGSFSYYNLVSYNGMARLNTDGTLDLSFQPGTGTMNPITAVADTVYVISIQPDGNILIGGDFTTYNQTRRLALARVFADGSLDTSFMDTAYNEFAGLPNRYFNPNAVATDSTYLKYNTRNAVYALAQEPTFFGTTNMIVGGTFTRVGGGSTRNDIHPRSNVARVIGGGTPGPGNIEFSYTSYSVANSETSLYVSLVRTNGNLGIISATFSTNTAAPGPGIASGADFSLNPIYGNPTWDTAWYNGAWMYDFGDYGPNYNLSPPAPRGAGAVTGNPVVYVDVFNPGNISGNLSANFALSWPIGSANFQLGGQYIPLGAALGTQNTAPLTIIDSNVKPGVVGFSSPVYTVIQGGQPVITLTRTNGTDNPVSVLVATSDGTATNGIDYTGITNTVVPFGIGQATATFSFTTVKHKVLAPDKTVNLHIYTPSGGAALGLTNAVLTVVNNTYEPGHVAFSQSDYPVNENGGNVVITVSRLGGSATTLGVTLKTLDGTAFNHTNYLGITTNLFWNSGDTTNRTISIPVMDDGIVTPNLTAYLQLTNSQVSGTNSAAPLAFSGTNATLTVVNVDSAGSIQFSSPNYAVKKYGSYAQIPVTRVGGSVGAVTVSFTTADDTAVSPGNYIFVTNTLTFANGEVSKFIDVPVLDDGVTNNPAGPKDLLLQLSNPTGFATLGTPSQAKLYIIDSEAVDETPGSPDASYSAFAGFNNNVYALALQPNNQLLVGGDFTMADGVARNRIARLNSDGTLDAEFSLPANTYGAGDSVRTIALQADGRILIGGLFTNFNSVARNHVARINPDGTLDNLFNPGAGADNPVYAVTQTFVNGNPMVLVAGAFASVNGTTFNGIGRLNSDGTPDTTFNAGGAGANATVYAMAVQTDGKIVIGGDFTSVNGQGTFNHIGRLNADGSADTNFNVSVTGPSDSVRTITLQLDGKILIGGLFTSVNGVARNHIARLNNDGTLDTSFVPGVGANDAVFALGIQQDNRIVVGGEFTTCSGVTRNRITRLNPDGSVDPSINFGIGANNFVAAIAIQEDTISGYPTNVPDEKIIIGGGFTEYFGESHPHLARIYGGSIGGSGGFQFSSPTYSVHESGTNVLITVVRTGGTTNAPTGDIFVTAFTTNGTAFAGTNYVAVSTNLDFPLGEVIESFVVPVLADGVVTPNLTVKLAISNPTPPAAIGNQPTAVLTIINDDSVISLSSSNYQVPKNIVSGTAAIPIIRQGGISGTSTVLFSTTGNGTAIPSTDFTPVSQLVTFNPGVSNVTVYIPINNNGIPEGNRTVTMQIANVTGSALVNPTNATLTIVDTVNAPGQVSFVSATYSILEGGGVGSTNVYVTIQRTYGEYGSVSVGYTTQDGTAVAGVKYAPTNGVITFGDNETSKTISVPVLNTATAEGPETFAIYLFTNILTGSTAIVSPTNTVITIFNTNTGIAFASAANSFTEPSGPTTGTVLLNVLRFNNTNGTTTVNYSTTNGTATADTPNYVGITNGTLTFNPGESVKSIAITTLHDTNVTGDLFFTVGLANPSGGAQLTAPAYTVVTDHDADAGLSFLASATSVYRNAGYVIIPVFCSNTNVEPVFVQYSTGGGDAVAGVDYTATSGTLAFTNGVALNYFIVPILLNNAVQTNRMFDVTLSSPTAPGVLLPPSTEAVTIVGTNTPAGLSFSTPIIINGIWGTTNANNTLGAPEAGDPGIAGQSPSAPVWFEWTTPPGADGEVTLDTIGSVDTNGMKLDTVLAVYSGTSLGNLSQLAANDDLYPLLPATQVNEVTQNIFNTNDLVSSNSFTFGGNTYTFFFTNFGNYNYVFQSYTQPYAGPSGLRFNAKGGTTYYIAADTKSGFSYVFTNGTYKLVLQSARGQIQLNWAYHSSGVFRFATENVDQTGILSTNGNPMLLYQCAETEGQIFGDGHRVSGNPNPDEYKTTYDTYYPYDVAGLLVTVTRVAGSSGRVMVDYATQDGDTNLITNGDIPAVANFTNILVIPGFGLYSYVTSDYIPVKGTLIFDDFEMSKTIRIPIVDDFGMSQPNRDFTVVLSNPRRDPAESGDVSAPRVDQIFGQVLCRILDCDIDPKGPSAFDQVFTNFTSNATNIFTNTIVSLIPTNAVFNFSKANYRVPRDVQAWFGANSSVPVTVYVNRSGTNTSAVTVHYRFDNYSVDKVTGDDWNNYFPLQPGSDYATPTPANAGGRQGANSDFAGVGGDSGTLSFPGAPDIHTFDSQPIHFNLQNNHIPGFNKDILIGIYEEDSKGNPLQDGMVLETTVTILFDDTAPSAGSVDELYNPDFASDLALLTNSLNLNTSVLHPGTDPNGEVYSVVQDPINQPVINGAFAKQTIIGGAFATYTDSTNTYMGINGIARLNSDGSLDPTFNSTGGTIGSGVNVSPGGEFIRSVALATNKTTYIGGDFTSFNNTRRNCIARLNPDGTLDTTFKPGAGANGTVWSVQLQGDGKAIIGGEFTTYNGAPANHVARLNIDGTLDTSFNASNMITGPVYAMSLSPAFPLSFARSSTGSANEDDQFINLGLQTSGTLYVQYDMSFNTNDLRIYYGDTNVAAGTGVLIFESTSTTAAFTPVAFGPVNGFTTNTITVVVNQGGSIYAAPLTWSYNLSMPGAAGLVIGGNFNVVGQSFANLARLNLDGSLDTSFNPGTGPDGSVLSLGWQFDNKIIVGGSFKNLSGVPFNDLARLNSDGSIDPSFFIGTGADNSVNSIMLQPISNLIYVGGKFTSMNGTHRLGFARLHTDGTVDTSFLDMAYNQFAGLPRILFGDAPGAVYASALQSDGNVIIGGSFQEVGGGQADANVRAVLEKERLLTPSTTNADLLVSDGGGTISTVLGALEPKTRDGLRNRSNLARLIGGSTTGPGNIGMVQGSYGVNRTQSSEPVTLVRANGSLGYASANFAVLPGLAKSGVDFSYSSPPPLYPIEWEYSGPTRMHSDGLFGANGLMQGVYGELVKYGINGPAAVNITILNNSAFSGDLSAQLQMANPSQADQFYLGGQDIPLGVALGESQAPLTLIDNSQPAGTFGFATPNYIGSNSPVSVLVNRTSGTFGTVSVLYQTVTNGSTAVAGVDYRPTNSAVPMVFNNGGTSNSFLVTLLNNSSVSPQEKTVNMQVYGLQGSSSAQLGLTNAVLRIINPNFAGYLSFSTNAYYGKVSSGMINFTVTRTVGSKGTLTLQYATANGTAHNGVDYVGATNTLTWNNGDVSPRTLSVPLINNNLVGPNKLFTATLLNASLNGASTPSLLGSITNAIFAIINDNSYGSFQLSSPTYQVNENGGYATINVTRGGSAAGTATVSFATADGTAFAGTNYIATNNTLTFLPGQVFNSFHVRLLDDGKTNPPPAGFYFAVGLSNPSSGASLGSPTNSLVHIVDAESYNEQPGSIDLSFDPNAGLNASVLALALQSNGQLLAGGSFTVANGTAVNRIARFNTDGTLDGAFMSGLAGADGSVNAVLTQTDDRIVIGGAFSSINGGTRQRLARLMTDGSVDTSFNSGGGADSTVFALAESFVSGARVIYAGGAFNDFNGVFSPGIVRLNNNGLVDAGFNVGLGAVGTVYAMAVYPTNTVYNVGKVLVGGLFTNFNGSVVGNLARLNSDGSLDTNFTVNVSVGGAVRALAIQLDGGILVGGDFTNVNAASASHIARLNADGTLDAAFTAAAAPGIGGTVDTITLQADDRIVVGGQFVTANGVTRQNITRLLPTGAVDPTINFGSGANGSVNAAVIQPADGKIVIGGNFTQYNGQERDHIARIFGGSMTGSGAFQFTSANYQIDETGQFAGITIERTGGTSGTNADGTGDVFVAFTTTNGTAVVGVNYSFTTNYVDFPAGEVLKTVYVPVIDDKVITNDLTVNLNLSNPTPGTTLGDQADAVLTIINDDSAVEFRSTTYSVPKNTVTGLANVDVVRIGTTSGSCTVSFATATNGTAVVGTDYWPTNILVTFYPGDTNATVQVPIINNNLPEGSRTVAMTLTNAVNSLLFAPSNAVLTIQDTANAPGQFFFAGTNFSANSADSYAYLTVARTNGTKNSVTVQYAVLPGGTAVAGRDYVNPSPGSSVTFNDGDTNQIIGIKLINNPSPQGAVNLFVQLSMDANQPVGAALIAPTNALVTINNTNAVIGFALATNTVAENFSPANIVVQRFNNFGVVSTVNYATIDGTGSNAAVAGINYSNTAGVLTFGVGEVVKSISIPLINQSNIVDTSFGVNLFSPTHAQLIAPTNTVVIIEGAAAGVSFTTNTATITKTGGALLVTVVCSNPRVEPVASSNQVPLSVNFTTVDGTAKAGINYNPTNGVIVFTNGIGTNSFYVPIFNDGLVTGDRTFSVILTNVTWPGYLKPYGTQAVTIVEANPGLRFAQADYSFFKTAGVVPITVYRTGSTNDTVAVDYAVTNGTAIGGQNFYPTNGTLVFSNGLSSQAFNVVLIANTKVQPNLYALMQLSNPTNVSGGPTAQLMTPSAATLTIIENGGSYVVPAGAMVVTNYTSHLNDGIIGSNDTVQVLFGFRDAAGLRVTNLIAALIATNGVTAPSPAIQIYGPLAVYGHSVSQPFTFTAHSTNSYILSPTFQLYDNDTYIGPATFNFSVGSWTTSFANTNAIIINDNAAASPYPSIINVSGLGHTLVKATITLTNLSDQSFADLSALVVSPTTNTLLMGHVGGSGIIVKHITLTFDDAATNSLPLNGVPVTGTNRPTQNYPIQNFP